MAQSSRWVSQSLLAFQVVLCTGKQQHLHVRHRVQLSTHSFQPVSGTIHQPKVSLWCFGCSTGHAPCAFDPPWDPTTPFVWHHSAVITTGKCHMLCGTSYITNIVSQRKKTKEYAVMTGGSIAISSLRGPAASAGAGRLGRRAASSCCWTPRPSRLSCWSSLLQVPHSTRRNPTPPHPTPCVND